MIGGLELVKWLAFVAMLLDHVDLAFYDRELVAFHAIGRFALPVFAACFGIGLARSADPLRVASRLVLPGLLAQLAWLNIPGGPDPYAANVLLAFAACAAVVAVGRRSTWLGVALFVLGFCAYPLVEGGYITLLIVAGAVIGERFKSIEANGLGLVALVLGAPSIGAFAGAVAPHLARRLPFAVPRAPGLFAWAYAGHLWLLVAAQV